MPRWYDAQLGSRLRKADFFTRWGLSYTEKRHPNGLKRRVEKWSRALDSIIWLPYLPCSWTRMMIAVHSKQSSSPGVLKRGRLVSLIPISISYY